MKTRMQRGRVLPLTVLRRRTYNDSSVKEESFQTNPADCVLKSDLIGAFLNPGRILKKALLLRCSRKIIKCFCAGYFGVDTPKYPAFIFSERGKGKKSGYRVEEGEKNLQYGEN